MPLPYFRKLVSTLLFTSLLYSCSQDRKENKKEQMVTIEKKSYRLQTFRNEDSTFGYSIFENEQLFIQQKNIPGLSGNQGFKNEKEAKGCGLLMKDKLEKGIWPPSVHQKELDSLNSTLK